MTDADKRWFSNRFSILAYVRRCEMVALLWKAYEPFSTGLEYEV